MTSPKTLRRAGYAPDTTSVGRRGQHTRERILARAADLFVAHGYHDTSIESIAKAVGGSRAVIYQYFPSKVEIFNELVAASEPAVLAHITSLDGLGPDERGIDALHRWLTGWATLYDRYAVVFAALPGVGTVENSAGSTAGVAPGRHTEIIAATLARSGVHGMEPTDAAAALLRICHMLNLARFRAMFGLDNASGVPASLTAAMQRLLFPETPAPVIARVAEPSPVRSSGAGTEDTMAAEWTTSEPDDAAVSPIRQDILSAASVVFAERGYFAASVDDIAAAAEVSRATLYRHFRSKALILDELSTWAAVECAHLGADLRGSAQHADVDELHSWLSRYVRYHRMYAGVIRAWYDGAISGLPSGPAIVASINELHRAAQSVFDAFTPPPSIRREVAAAIFLAVLGRLSEYAVAEYPSDNDYDAATFMLLVLQRALLT
ncbi:TetR/AcrR family transcriptional regulator [Mycobacterium sp. 236(2023)]|uniref:TetR/AcrR family transcriptional regulator n=1 Tax=Mycobacterium sp. 236(2023) TaxID=3038163 RepID=UPI0024158693|nr:TetR/AcrR family transcriptional regulator [Mycobacterium sp. 236(2023)]MDG4668102.1 TetR/AcrR family transcriptional regulator [Mycobacterium sp. 236(2023)]